MRASPNKGCVVAAIMFLVPLGIGLASAEACPDQIASVSPLEPCVFVGVYCYETFHLLHDGTIESADWSEELQLPPGLQFTGGQGLSGTVSGVPTTPGSLSLGSRGLRSTCRTAPRSRRAREDVHRLH